MILVVNFFAVHARLHKVTNEALDSLVASIVLDAVDQLSNGVWGLGWG